MLPYPRMPKHLIRTWDVVHFLHFGMRAMECYTPLGCCFSTVSGTNIFNSSKALGDTPHEQLPKCDRDQEWDISWQLKAPIRSNHHVGPPEVLMKNGNRQLFSPQTLSPLLCERALSNTGFSWAFACMSSPPGTDIPISQTKLSSLEVHGGGASSQNVTYCPTRALLFLCCCFSRSLT